MFWYKNKMATSNREFGKDYNSCDANGVILGIDIGTTSIKAALVNRTSKQIIARERVEHRAQIESENDDTSQRREQLVNKILTALNQCVKQLPDHTLKDVKDIVVCGQMHGCVLWNGEKLLGLKGLNMEEKFHQNIGNFVSSLITWEDGRCSAEFLSSLPKPNSMAALASGFGCASLFWLQKHTSADVLPKYDRAGTVMDFVVACLCASEKVYMSSQNACSWGYYDAENRKWELEKLLSQNFPTHLLPEVCEPGYIVGELCRCWCGIPSGTVVRVALGDMQCSILATLSGPLDAVLNIGTSAQLSVIIREDMKDGIAQEILSYPALHLLPYFNNCHLIVAAALTGGNTLAFFVKMLRSWMRDLGLQEPCDDVIYEKLSECSSRNLDRNCPKLAINPALWGERHDQNQSASVTGISCESLSLGNVYNSLCHGLLTNIEAMMSGEFLKMCGVQNITGTGNVLVRNGTLQRSVQDVFNLSLVVCRDADASVGAALSAV